MKRRLSLLPLVLLLPLAPAASPGEQLPADADVVFPQRLSARELLYACNSSSITQVGRERRRYGAGFISGVEEAARLLQARRGYAGSASICLPVDLSSRRLADIFTRYAGQHESMLEEPAAKLALDALTSAFPARMPAARESCVPLSSARRTLLAQLRLRLQGAGVERLAQLIRG